jgi:hypothetical protein
MTKKYIILGVTILVAIGIGAVMTLARKPQKYTCINNRRQTEAPDIFIKRDAYVLSIVPPGTSFSNAVAILGSRYTRLTTNSDQLFYVSFPCSIPGVTNKLHATLLVTNNIVAGIGYLKGFRYDD